MTWQAVHVYHYGDHNALLLGVIGPVVEELRRDGAIRRWFFLRYWEGGPHLRVRLEPTSGADSRPMSLATARLSAYLRTHTSRLEQVPLDEYRDLHSRLAALEHKADADLVEPDTVRSEPYEPEYGKYGGARGVDIAEDIFCASSDIVTRALSTASSSPRRLGSALTMTLAGAVATGMSARRLVGFFGTYERVWRQWVPAQLTSSWEAQASATLPKVVRVVENVLSGDGTGELTGEWAIAVRRGWRRVEISQPSVLDDVTLAGPTAPPVARAELLLANYLHTHNNRLGISPGNEAYLAYVLGLALSTVVGESTDAAVAGAAT